jgi:hypothetical protein
MSVVVTAKEVAAWARRDSYAASALRKQLGLPLKEPDDDIPPEEAEGWKLYVCGDLELTDDEMRAFLL